MSEFDLLREYVDSRSSQAFAELAERYVNLVYATARRQSRDAALAEDITQAVFLLLARKAASIATDRPLSGWLLRATHYCAANARRACQKREVHERRAAEMMARDFHADANRSTFLDDLGPLLDEGLARLRAKDRDAVLLRFFESKTHSEVGGALGISEAAAIKRVNRAVDRLRDYFQRRGVALSASALSTALVAESSKPAPITLVHAITASVAAPAAPAVFSIAKGAMILVAIEKAKLAAIAALVLLLGVGAGVITVKKISAQSNSSTIKLALDLNLTKLVAPGARNNTPLSTATAQTGPTFPIQLSDGCIIETLGISDPGVKPAQWWSANGVLESKFIVASSGQQMVFPEPNQQQREFIFRITGPVRDHVLSAEFAESDGIAQGTSVDNDLTQHCRVAFPKDRQTTSVHFLISHGPWHIDETRAPADTAPPACIQSIAASGNQTVATLRPFTFQDFLNRATHVYAQLKNQKKVECSSQSNGLHAWTFTFPCKLDQVADIVIASRPNEQVVMRNVALNPTTHPTSIEVNRGLAGR